MFKSCGFQKIDKANGSLIVLQLTPKVDKDVYLFVSGFEVINFDISVLFLIDLIDR